jgi:hypothetical protein
MAGTTATDNALRLLMLNGTTWASIADNTASTPATTLYISLHTASPGKTGTQSSSETSYTGYARVAVTRDSAGWTVSGAAASNTAQVTFGKCTAGTPTLTHFGVGLSSTGTGTLIEYAALNSPLTMAVGATPLFEAGTLQLTAD